MDKAQALLENSTRIEYNLSPEALERPKHEQAMFYNLYSAACPDKYDKIVSNFKWAAFAMAWYCQVSYMNQDIEPVLI